MWLSWKNFITFLALSGVGNTFSGENNSNSSSNSLVTNMPHCVKNSSMSGVPAIELVNTQSLSIQDKNDLKIKQKHKKK